MGITTTQLTLKNPLKSKLSPIHTKALADTGALHLCIPEHMAIQLELTEREKREVTLVDGSKRLVSYVGPVELSCTHRRCYVGAMVFGEEVLLGAIPMEDMDLIVHPAHREVKVNPLNPNIPLSIAKGMALTQV